MPDMRPHHSGTSVITLLSRTVFVFISWVLLVIPVHTADYYCENGGISGRIISGDDNGTIHTLLQGQSYYGNSYHCRWIIDAGSETRKLQLTVISTNMQWAPESAICTEIYDNVIVRDGNSEKSRIIIQWCGSRNPYSITSTGRNLSISFKTNSKNPYNYKGVHIKFEVFEADVCPPGWSSPSPSDPNCYSVKGHPEIWSDAQAFCNYEQGNLVTIDSQELQTYINDLGMRSGVLGGIAWIGLSKITSESTMEWIDNQPVTVKFFKGSNRPADKDCVLMDFNSGSWMMRHCTRVHAAFVCRTLRRGENIIYEQPAAKEEVDEQSSIAIVLAGVLGSLAVIIGIGAVILVWLKCVRHKQPQQSDHNEATTSQTDAPTTANSRRSQGRNADRSMQLSEVPPNYSQIMPSPPSYDEVIAEKYAG